MPDHPSVRSLLSELFETDTTTILLAPSPVVKPLNSLRSIIHFCLSPKSKSAITRHVCNAQTTQDDEVSARPIIVTVESPSLYTSADSCREGDSQRLVLDTPYDSNSPTERTKLRYSNPAAGRRYVHSVQWLPRIIAESQTGAQ